jgi:hypothetical protein
MSAAAAAPRKCRKYSIVLSVEQRDKINECYRNDSIVYFQNDNCVKRNLTLGEFAMLAFYIGTELHEWGWDTHITTNWECSEDTRMLDLRNMPKGK